MDKITSAAILVVAILCVLPTFIMSSPTGAPNNFTGCQQLSERPDYDEMDVDTVKSDDNKALATFVGALSYRNAENKIVWSPINVTAARWSQVDELTQKMTLTDACAELTFYTHLSPSNDHWWLEEMYLTVVDSDGLRKTCYSDLVKYYPSGTHGKLLRDPLNRHIPRLYLAGCDFFDSGEDKIELEFKILEFELNGDANIIRNGDFSTRAHFDS